LASKLLVYLQKQWKDCIGKMKTHTVRPIYFNPAKPNSNNGKIKLSFDEKKEKN